MQTWITDYDFCKSAQNLDRRRLQANIYESIQILASLLDCTDKLVNPKRNIKNYPQAKLWEDYEYQLMIYNYIHVQEWIRRGYKYENTITEKNCIIILKNKNDVMNRNNNYELTPDWITDELIQVHRSVLIQKEPEHYKKLWPGTSNNLKMHYDWRKEE